jgi:hypothetical protein
MSDATLQHALQYIERGWFVLPLYPLHPPPSDPAKLARNAWTKEPLGELAPHGANSATNDPDVARQWWGRYPSAGIGVALEKSGLIGFDVDPRNGGGESFDTLTAEHGRIESNVHCLTGGGGFHLYFQNQERTKLPQGCAGLGIDIKTGGYLVAPPTIHPSGRAYEWEASSDPLDGCIPSSAPAWLLSAGQKARQTPPNGATSAALVVVDTKTVRDLRSALNALSADDYQQWIAIGHALKELGSVGRGLWLDWSQASDKWNPEDARKWDGFTGHQTGYLAVFSKAQAAGWVNPASKSKASEPPNWNDTSDFEGDTAHPLALFVDLTEEPRATRWVIPGFIGHGVTVIAGAQGAGKTTTLLPLAMQVAGMATGAPELAPLHWRHVVYIVEDLEQAQRIVSGLVRYGGLGIDFSTVRERLHIVEARRLAPGYVAQVGKLYCEQFTRQVQGVDVLPLVVIDTMAATLDLENESDNSEASRAMAALKQGFRRLPVWLIGHIPKAVLTRNDVGSLTARGAGAWEGDANQVMYLVQDGDARFLVRGKTRFEARWPELAVTSHCTTVMAGNEYGGMEPVGLRWSTIAPPQQTRQEAATDAQEQVRKGEAADMRQTVRDAVQIAWQEGFPLNRASVKAKIPRKAQDVVRCIENLLSERWLYEVPVPAKDRAHSSRAAFLVNLDTLEHEAFVRDGVLPDEKMAVPNSWKKQQPPPVPEKSAPDEKTAVLGTSKKSKSTRSRSPVPLKDK